MLENGKEVQKAGSALGPLLNPIRAALLQIRPREREQRGTAGLKSSLLSVFQKDSPEPGPLPSPPTRRPAANLPRRARGTRDSGTEKFVAFRLPERQPRTRLAFKLPRAALLQTRSREREQRATARLKSSLLTFFQESKRWCRRRGRGRPALECGTSPHRRLRETPPG